MNDTEKMLSKQYLLQVRQEGYTLVENPPQSFDGINIDIYRGKTKICTFDDRQLGGWSLRVRTDDSTRAEIKHDYGKLFRMFIDLRNLYMIYDSAEPIRGYDQSLGYRAITQHGNCVLAVRGGNRLGEIEFGTFITGSNSYNNSKTIKDNIFFDIDCYPLAKLNFTHRSGLLPKEQLVTPDNIKYLLGSCSKTMEREGGLLDDDTKAGLRKVITCLEKADDAFLDVKFRTSEMPANFPCYIDAKILGVNGIFTKYEVDRATVPNGLHAYDIQHSSDTMTPEKLWPRVIGRRFGTVITKKPLHIGENGYTELGDKDFSMNSEKRPTLKAFQASNKERER